MNGDLFSEGRANGLADLERDLTEPGGPSISTMRNHNFAILLYPPEREYELRAGLRGMVRRLEDQGFGVLDMDLQGVLFERLRTRVGPEVLQGWIDQEKRLYASSPERALNHLRNKLGPHVDGITGITAEIEQRIAAQLQAHPDDAARTLVLLGNVGALYPFFRSSALLKQLGGRTANVPVVLLYPGKRADGGLSFMQELVADRDYRPRIYDWGTP